MRDDQSSSAAAPAIDRISAAFGLAAVVLITVAVVAPVLGGDQEAERAAARADANAIGVALRAAADDCGDCFLRSATKAPRWFFGPGVLPRENAFAGGERFPLSGIVVSNATRSPAWRGPYLDRVPIDPWGRAYVAGAGGEGGRLVAILSAGPDGVVTTKPGDGVVSGDDVGIVMSP